MNETKLSMNKSLIFCAVQIKFSQVYLKIKKTLTNEFV
jgi:hypothetical protein